jgi:hypothetical protein
MIGFINEKMYTIQVPCFYRYDDDDDNNDDDNISNNNTNKIHSSILHAIM